MSDERALEQAFLQGAPYLFHKPGAQRMWDLGPKSFQCTRRGDALKVWMVLQRYGVRTIGALYDRLCDTTRKLHELIGENSNFEAMHEPECNILCFRYVGDGSSNHEQLDQMNYSLRQRYNSSGEGWITMTVLQGRRVLRTTLMNPRTTEQHLRTLLDGLERTVREITASG
jgi:L-2,4-diaminobutyrate decarboxylase